MIVVRPADAWLTRGDYMLVLTGLTDDVGEG